MEKRWKIFQKRKTIFHEDALGSWNRWNRQHSLRAENCRSEKNERPCGKSWTISRNKIGKRWKIISSSDRTETRERSLSRTNLNSISRAPFALEDWTCWCSSSSTPTETNWKISSIKSQSSNGRLNGVYNKSRPVTKRVRVVYKWWANSWRTSRKSSDRRPSRN